MKYSYLLLWAALVALLYAAGGRSFLTEENGYLQRKTKRGFAVLSFLPIIYFVVTAPYMYWGDYYNYMDNYYAFPDNFADAAVVVAQQENSWLFYWLIAAVKVFSGGNLFVYRLVLACIQTFPILFLFCRYSTDYPFAVYLFLVMATPLAWMLNGVRQLCAAAVLYGSTKYVLERKYAKSLFWFVVACLTHQSSVIMLPMMIVAQGPAWNKKTLYAIAGTVLIVFLFSSRAGAFDDVMGAVGYDTSHYVTDDGVHPLRVLVNFVPVFLSFMFRKNLQRENAPILNYCTNMAIMTFCLYAVGMVTSGILIGRLPLYTYMYSFILLPYLFRCFRGSMAGFVKVMAVLGYGLYYYAQYGLR